MIYEEIQREKAVIKNNFLFILFLALGSLFYVTSNVQAQTPSPSPSEAPPVVWDGYTVTSSMEFGVRGVSVDGSDNKYKSDFNYKPGFRIFDSSFLMEDKTNKKKWFDSLLIKSSGWNADPTGFVRVNVEKIGIYRLDSNVRQVKYFNNLNNHALNQHNFDTRHSFGDADLTILPQNENLRFRLGASFNQTRGPGVYTTRAYSDEFPVSSFLRVRSSDFRGGIEGKLLGFNLSLSHGVRIFDNNTSYELEAPHPGNAITGNARLVTFQRVNPVNGTSHYTTFHAQQTFAKRLDFTARVVYSSTKTDFRMLETISGRDGSNNIIDLDRFDIFGDAKRPQTRGDLGLTYAVTDNFRISNTFTFDTYNISGGNIFAEAVFRRTAAGGPLASQFTNNTNYRVTSFRRFVNTIEGDYQFNNRLGINLGYRYTNRNVVLEGFDRPLPPSTANPTFINEEGENQTNTLLAGMKLKPLKNWAIFADLEHGESDNAFTRLSNYNVTNFRVRSRWSFNQFSFNVSAMSKDNTNPSRSIVEPTREFIANIKSRIFSGHADWTPSQIFSFSAGYTYQHLTSETDIIVPVTIGGSNQRLPGFSRFFMRDNYAFFDVTAQPVRWASVYASYRISKDTGQGDQLTTDPRIILTSYPFQLQSPEVRLAFRISRNIEWNVGYQYFGYKERFQSAQDYRAHLPYTSLKIYIGGGR